MTKQRMVLVYCLGIFAASWALQLAGIYSVHSKVENNAITPWLVVAMMTPALGVLILKAFYKTAREDVSWKTNWRTLAFAPYSVLIPTLVAFGEIGIFAWVGFGDVRMVPVLHCWRSGVRRALAIRSLVALILAAGEELGWRGYLQERLIHVSDCPRGLFVWGSSGRFGICPCCWPGTTIPRIAIYVRSYSLRSCRWPLPFLWHG